MTENFSFDIYFDKFDFHKTIEFSQGLNIVYGESGSGKSELILSLLQHPIETSGIFSVTQHRNDINYQLVFQNPENQIICPDIESEISFGLECDSRSYNDFDISTELEKIKLNLPTISDWRRHPSTLSGGEMEMLNLVTAFNTDCDVVFIDDGLSYLNEKSKKLWVKWIKENYEKDKTVIWFTSDLSDLSYSPSSWILSLSDLKRCNLDDLSQIYNHCHRKGVLSVDINDLSFNFSDANVAVIDNFNLNINNARSLGIIGENGSGKTTLVNIILNSLKPTSGFVDIAIGDSKPLIGALNQFPERMLGTDTLDELLKKLEINHVFDINLKNSFIKKLKSYQINWESVKNKSVRKLPWSITRMCLIIILSMSKYDLIILDEPTFGFGFQQKKKLSDLIQGILVNKHLILISHDIEFIDSHCDQILDFNDKSIILNEKLLIHEK